MWWQASFHSTFHLDFANITGVAGNTIVLKPSETVCSLAMFKVMELFERVGFTIGQCNEIFFGSTQ
jgi:hypothetical protein